MHPLPLILKEKLFLDNKKPPCGDSPVSWELDYQGTTDDPIDAKYVAKVIEDTANLAKPLAQAKMMADVMPLWPQITGASQDVTP